MLCDGGFLKQRECLSLISRRVFRGSLLAQRRTKQMGGGIEFADHREYTPGGAFRHVDWNDCARRGDLALWSLNDGRRLSSRRSVDGTSGRRSDRTTVTASQIMCLAAPGSLRHVEHVRQENNR